MRRTVLRTARSVLGGTVLSLVAVGRIARAQSAETPGWRLNGSYLNLYSRTRTVIPAPEGVAVDLNRLRLKVQASGFDGFSLDIQYDNELLAGSYIGTEQFTAINARVPVTGPELERDYARGEEYLARQRLYRATVAWSGFGTDVKVGRQRVALGTGQFWSPLDLLNPIDPTRLERDYRSGVNAVLVEQRLGAVARVDGVYAPATGNSRAVAAGYLHGNTRGTDYSFLAGTFRGDRALGADFATSAGGSGVRGEATITRPAVGATYVRALLGADYAFPNTLTITAEAYFNGQGASDPARYDLGAVLSGRVLNVARRYAAVAISYEITPLLTFAVYGVLNADDRSGVVWPRLEYSLASNLDFAAGVQRFGGRPATEYGRVSNLVHFETRWFF